MKKSIVKGIAYASAVTAAAVTTVLLHKRHRAKKAARQMNAQPQDEYIRAEKAEQVSTDYYASVKNAYDGGPNANPVYSPKTETPRTEDGKIDVTKLASPEDFCNWEEHGCQG